MRFQTNDPSMRFPVSRKSPISAAAASLDPPPMPRPTGYPLRQLRAHPTAIANGAAQIAKRAVHQVIRPGSPASWEFPVIRNSIPGSRRDSRVSVSCSRDGLKNRAQLVIAVRPAAQDFEAQVDLCICGDADGFHRRVCYYGLGSAGDFCCAARCLRAAIFCSTSLSFAGSRSRGHDAAPFLDRLLILRLGEAVLAHLGVDVAEVAQDRGVVALLAAALRSHSSASGSLFCL